MKTYLSRNISFILKGAFGNEGEPRWLCVVPADFYQCGSVRSSVCPVRSPPWSSPSPALMPSQNLMKKECFTSGTVSSASFRRRFIRKRRVAPGGQHDAATDCQLCR